MIHGAFLSYPVDAQNYFHALTPLSANLFYYYSQDRKKNAKYAELFVFICLIKQYIEKKSHPNHHEDVIDGWIGKNLKVYFLNSKLNKSLTIVNAGNVVTIALESDVLFPPGGGGING